MPAGSFDDDIDEETPGDAEPSGRIADEPIAAPGGESDLAPDEEPDLTAAKPPQKRSFGRRSSAASPEPISDGTEHALPTAGDRDRRDAALDKADVADDAEIELPRGRREAEQADGRDTGAPQRPLDPQTDEDLAAAANELGISFRDEPRKGQYPEPPDADDETARVARQLGIRFRDDPGQPTPTDPDDPTAKAARELGISFRDMDRPKAKQQSTLKRYWPIILVMALASIAMPVAATLMMFYWT